MGHFLSLTVFAFLPARFLDLLAHALLGLRNRHFWAIDVLALCLTPAIALMLRTDANAAVVLRYVEPLALFTLVALACKQLVFFPFGLYQRYWRYASVEELGLIVLAALVSLAVDVLVYFGILRPLGWIPADFPRSLPFLDGILTLLVVGGSRFSMRLAMGVTRQRSLRNASSALPIQPVLIMGAGDAGAMIVREMRNNPHLGLDPIGFLDDDPGKRNVRIHGVPVLGDRQALPALAKEYHVKQVIIAMPTAPGKAIREIVRICGEAGLQTRIIPGIYEFLGSNAGVNQLRDVRIEDLLRRDPVQIDASAIVQMIHGKRVLVTGAGGSIGSELCRQIVRCEPAALILLGHGENSIFEIHNELKNVSTFQRSNVPTLVPVIADIRFPERLCAVFEAYRPEIVFHAAAHKHVPLMEQNEVEAVTNNLQGTRNLIETAIAKGVERFVMISTDKAVNPTSVMGTSKRIAELIVRQAAARTGLPYVAVRFGNVLGSRGSVVPFFKKQIAAGGPVTVTHPEMKRFFMTIPEAVQLVLQAAVLGKGGEVFALDMGEPVRIADLANDLIRLSGLEPDRDIDVIYTGLRPGEKLYEELFAEREDYTRTRHEKIFVCSNGTGAGLPPGELDTAIDALVLAAYRGEAGRVRELLCNLVPEYQPREGREDERVGR